MWAVVFCAPRMKQMLFLDDDVSDAKLGMLIVKVGFCFLFLNGVGGYIVLSFVFCFFLHLQ